MTNGTKTLNELLAENGELRQRLEDAEETLRAIQSGEVDALVISGPEGEQIFTLQGAETPYRLLVESMNEGAANLAADGTILYCNSRLAAMLQLPLERVIGTRLASFVGPADRAVYADRLKRCAEECDRVEIALISADGNPLPVLFSCFALKFQGRPGIGAVLTDIRVQKEAEALVREIQVQTRTAEERERAAEALRESEQRMQQALRVSRSFTFEWEPATDRLRRSESCSAILALYGDEAVTDTGRNFFQRVHPEDREQFMRIVRELTPSAASYSTEYRTVRGDGGVISLEETGQATFDAGGKLQRLFGVATDISARKQAETALKKLNEELEERVEARTGELREKDQILIMQSRHAAMGEMLGNIAHQWRQPLNSVGLIMQTLTLMYDDGQLDKASLVSMEKQVMELVQHMSKTIDGFRNYFKPDKEKVTFHAGDAVQRTLSLVDASFKDCFIGTEVRVEDDPAITGFQNEYAQVLLNVLQNARDVLDSRKVNNPQVTVVVGSENGKSVVTITDNAGGIPDDIIHKVFDPYFTTKGPDKGTGVGLFMSKAIIEKNMGGCLTVRNTGDGAEFRIEV